MPKKLSPRKEKELGQLGLHMSSYGFVLLEWNDYELLIEMAIRNLLGITSREAHIVFGALAFKAKLNILLALGRQKKLTEHDAIKWAKAINKYAQRNHLIHGYAWHEGETIGFVKRNVDDRLRVAEKKFRQSELAVHAIWLVGAVHKFQEELGFTTRDVGAYRRSAESLIKRA
jgi:hypothetical protein